MADWFYMMAELPEQARQEVACWVLEQEWPSDTVLKRPSRYHVTIVYSFDGREREDLPALIAASSTGWNRKAHVNGVELFFNNQPGTLTPIVLTLQSPQLVQAGEIMLDRFEQRGFKVSRFEGGYKPHITVAMIPQGIAFNAPHPEVSFRLQPRATTGGIK